MKRIITICAGLIMTASVFAQAPEKMSYQAVVRNGSNALVTSTAVGMQISILQGNDSTGTAVYVETQTPTTNANGLVSLEIGSATATVISGDFTTIDWANGPYFIKTETDPTGGTAYTITGTSELLSVPYALHAKTAENGITTAQANAIIANTAKVGYTEALVSANADVVANTAKVGITTAQANAIIANTAKVGVTNGTAAGQMQYWNGTSWVTVAVGTTGQVLTIVNGAPTWATLVGPDDVVSTTGQIWMDRNLGASQVATSSTDAAAYGDLYQWGRAADGHESRTSNTTTALSSSDTPGHSDFIVSSGTSDWRNPQNDNLWQGVNGINNPCPSGYRLPTDAELNAEYLAYNINTGYASAAFATPMKLTAGGFRDQGTGALTQVGTFGFYWSSTVNATNANSMFFSTTNSFMNTNYRGIAMSVRCIKQ
jgi:uncharacterized protein (TIGR02145 family)